MKRFLLQFIICLTCFNLAGGYTFAVGVLSQSANAVVATDTHLSEGITVKKASKFRLQAPQINKEESDEDDAFVFLNPALAHSNTTYQFLPDFKLFNKHFLVHYGKAIKGSFPPLFLTNSVFRL